MTNITRDHRKSTVLGMLLAQFTAYVLLIAATVIPGASAMPVVPLIGTAAVLIAFVLYWPLRATATDRYATVVFAILSMAAVVVPVPSLPSPYSWALAVGLLLVALVIFSFGRQMARENRSHLIRSLSHAITSGVIAISVAGWCFLPDFGSVVARSGAFGVIGVIVLVLLGLALAVASILWTRDADPAPTAKHPWIGIGMMPVMLMGVAIAAAMVLLMQVLG